MDCTEIELHDMKLINPLIAIFAENINLQTKKLWTKSGFSNQYMWPWSTEAVISSTGVFVAIANNTLYGSKLYIFLPKSLGY